MSEIFRCIPDLPTLHRSFILVLSLAGGWRHHGASCYNELRKIRQCMWDTVGRPRSGTHCFETYLVQPWEGKRTQTQTRLTPVMTGFVCTISSAIRRQLCSGQTSRNENRVRPEKFWPVIQLHTGCWNHVMANKGMRKFALHSVHLFFNRAQTIRNNGTCVIHVAELNTLQYAANW